jgi:hypothetical protein
LATAFALYLWQTVILTFDLVFVWHRYIRHWRELGFSTWKPVRAQNSTYKRASPNSSPAPLNESVTPSA